MGIASLIVGIFAAIFAAIATAPCFGLVAIPTIFVATTGLLLGLAEFVNVGLAKARSRVVDPESISAARTGTITNSLALIWSVGCLFMKASM